MEISNNISKGIYRVTLSGSFSSKHHLAFHKVIEHIGDDQVKQVVLNMDGVDYIDSSALGMLLLARDEASKYKKEISINGAKGQVKKTLDIACFNAFFTIN